MSDFITAIIWIINTVMGTLWDLIINSWLLSLVALISIIGLIAELVLSSRSQ